MPEHEKRLSRARQGLHAGQPVSLEQVDRRLARAQNIFDAALPVVMRFGDIRTEGEFNTVFVHPPISGFVIKAPDDLAGYDTHRILTREVLVLELLEDGLKRSGIKLPVHVPRILADSTDETSIHTWAAFTAVPGKVMDRHEIWERFSIADYHDLGRKLGKFTVGVSQAVDVDSFRQYVSPFDRFVIDRERRLKQVLGELGMYEELGYAHLTRLLRQLGDDYFALQPEREAAKPIVVHDDLHQRNLAFEQSQEGRWELVEVFDWANAKIRSAASNFRHLALLSPEALQVAMETWQEETGEPIPEQLVKFWASLQFAIACTDNIRLLGRVTDYTTESMQRLHPEVDWQAEFSQATPWEVQHTEDEE